MKQQTYNKITEAFKQLQNKHDDILSFNNLEEFVEEVASLDKEVTGDGTDYFITRRTTERPYETNNVDLIHVDCEDAYDSVLYPSY